MNKQQKEQNMIKEVETGLVDQSLFLSQPALAREIAFEAHAGQKVDGDKDYITHPQRVAGNFDPIEEPLRNAAAWLHDAVEDSEGRITPEVLLARGILPRVVEVVELLTRDEERDKTDPDAYYNLINEDADARAVKLADLKDNTDPERNNKVSPERRRRLLVKYAHALDLFGEDDWANKLRERLQQS